MKFISELFGLFVLFLLNSIAVSPSKSLRLGDVGVCEKAFDPSCSGESCEKRKKLICCRGYEFEDESNNCIPYCHRGCKNGGCIKPEVCNCKYPLVLNDKKDECICAKGYKANETSFECVPICNPPCINGICSSPNTCTCYEGYKFQWDNKSVCKSECENSCINATCIEANCVCIEGHELSSNSWTCAPKCSSCNNGKCIAPDNCICEEGYRRINETCSPICSSCANGKCIAPYNCICEEGYKIINGTCSPICEEPCGNGFCSSPGVCNYGQKLEKNAGLELMWIIGGAVILLLVTLTITVIDRIRRNRKKYEKELAENEPQLGSVIYTVPNTLVRNNSMDAEEEEDERLNGFDASIKIGNKDNVNYGTVLPLLDNVDRRGSVDM